MRLLIFSDSHGRCDEMLRAVKSRNPDVIVHLGDFVRDTLILSENFPLLPMHVVSGNCDLGSPAPTVNFFLASGVWVFATHGHIFSVKRGYGGLVQAARQKNASLVLFGHTHRALNETVGGLTLLNPGAVGNGSFAEVFIDGNGSITSKILHI